jgi:ribosomal protein S18 acetylase RimI-like enzyme
MNNLNDHTTNEVPVAVQESNEMFISVWRLFANSYLDADITAHDGLVITWPDVPLFVYNNIFVTGQIHDTKLLEQRVSEAASIAQTKRQTGLITVCHDLLSGPARAEVDAILAQSGYVPQVRIMGMAGDLLPLTAPGHAALHIERADDNGVVPSDINCMAYGFPLQTGRESLPHTSLWKDAVPYVGFEGDRAVTTATTIVSGNCLYVALVATVPDARRRGYAEAVVRHSLQKAHEATGLTRTILHATDAGRSVYERLGYRASAQFMWYLPPSPK